MKENISSNDNKLYNYPETEPIISPNELALTPQEKRRLLIEFTRFVDIEYFIGSYALYFFALGLLAAIIVIIVITTTISHIRAFWFGVYVVISVCGIVTLTFIGYNIKKRTRRVKLEVLIDYVFRRLIDWTAIKLKHTKYINDRRLLIENLMATYYDYSNFNETKLWEHDEKLTHLYALIDKPINRDAINFSCKLFNVCYLDAQNVYSPKGVLLLVKIFLPMLNLSSDPHICSVVMKMMKKFMRDTNMNVFNSRVLNKFSLGRKEEVTVTKQIFRHKQSFLDLFEALWEGSSFEVQRVHEQMTHNAHSVNEIQQIESFKCMLGGRKSSIKVEHENENDNRLKSFVFLSNSPNIHPQDIITQNHAFGFHSQILSQLQIKHVEDKEKHCPLDFNTSNTQSHLSHAKSLEKMREALGDNETKHLRQNVRTLSIAGFMDKEATERLNDNHATCDSQRAYMLQHGHIERDEELGINAPNNIPLNERTSRNLISRQPLPPIHPEINRDKFIKRDILDNDSNRESDEPLEDFSPEVTIRFGLYDKDDNKRNSFSVDKQSNKSLISINHYEIPAVQEHDEVQSSAEVQHFLTIVNDDPSNFKTVLSKENLAIYQQTNEDSPVVLIRCDAVVRGNIDAVFTAIFNIEKRSQWDTVFSRLKILKVLDENTDVMYSFLKSPPCVTNRDFLQKRCNKRNIGGFDIIIAFTSYEDRDFPPIKNTIRANTIISGYGFKKIDENTTKLAIVSQTDIKGSIPVWIINKMASRAPADWVKRLEKAVADLKHK